MKYITIYKLFGFIVIFIPFYLGYNNYINNQIKGQINTPEYISKISKNLRPYLLINLNGHIIYDHGALEYIDSISFYPDSLKIYKDKIFGFGIKCKKLLNYPPIIENLTPHDFTIQSTRFNNIDWAVRIKINGFIGNYDNNEALLRIEIIS